jgi:hypothetical protein
MKKANVYKVVIMEDVKTSSTVWTQFIKADSKSAIEKYVSTSDCKIIYLSKLDDVEATYTDKPIDELINGEMIYHS